jgi:cell cycle sensor histidine kinase DivJ
MMGFVKKQVARKALEWAGSGLWQGDGDDVVALHEPDGTILMITASAQSVTGWAPQKLAGDTLCRLIVPEDRHIALAALSDAFCHGRKSRTECRILKADGSVCWMELTASPAPNGQVRTVMRDASARHAEAAAQDEARLAAETAAENRATYLADLSHEIRTPLNAVIGFADMMRAETFGPLGHAKYEEYAGLIHQSGEHLLSLVSDLLDLSKLEADKYRIVPEPVSVPELAESCVELMRLGAEEAGLKIRADVDDDGVLSMVDAKVVRQILLNLLSNAVKFTEKGGVTLRLRQDDENIWLSVLDTGIGMSAEDLARVGQRFEQAHREGVRGAKGTGLGLALCDALARVHGGELRLDSRLGEGTRVTLQLPRKLAEEEAPEAFDALGAQLNAAVS